VVVTFAAPRVDPSIVCISFLPVFFDYFIVGFDSAVDATKKSFTDYLGHHTDILLVQKREVARFISAPYSRPQGHPVICCGQEMEFRQVQVAKDKTESVKLRCRLRERHGPNSSRTKIVACAKPEPGVSEVVRRGGHRFMIIYSTL
jgi:hypothetical protein